jgi:alpha-1,3-fucosyltransferase 10
MMGGAHPSPSRPITLLIYNDFWIPVPSSNSDGLLLVTRDRAILTSADVVAFHLPTLGAACLPPKPSDQTWVGCWMESEVNYPHLRDPTLLSRFDITVSHRRDADVRTPYFGPCFKQLITTPVRPKTGGVVYLQSNDADRCGRRSYVGRLMLRMKVDSYGRSLNNKSLLSDQGRKTKLELIAQYKFTLAFENSIATDYVTEKFYDALAVGSVPLYRGAPNMRDLAPAGDCYIDANDFDTPEELASYVNHLLATPLEYETYLAWRQRGLSPAFSAALDEACRDPWSRVLELVRRRW